MGEPTFIVYKGQKSQTGVAVTEEFPQIHFQGGQESFDEIAQMIEEQAILAVLPMWNSHEGEITKAKALELLFENKAKLYRLWPKSIQFECLCKSNSKKDGSKKIISVNVAATQCSEFISNIGATFIEAPSTVDAYKEFDKTPDIDMALCTPGLNEKGYQVLCEETANPMNFTTFALLGCIGSKEWLPEQWGSLYDRLNHKNGKYLGVQIPIRTFVTSEDQEVLLSDLTDDANTLNEVPKVLFVARRSPSQCGLLIEAGYDTLASDILTEDGYSSEIEINLDLGVTNSRYPIRTNSFISGNFSELIQGDFTRHIGTQTCFFACPSLGIVTHGFEENVVEPVVRRIIAKLFELIDSGIDCSDTQRKLFKKYKKAYYNQGVDFINFTDVGL